jgi:hypothetical protein
LVIYSAPIGVICGSMPAADWINLESNGQT